MKTIRLLFPLLALLVLGGWFFKPDNSVLTKALEDIRVPLAQMNERYTLFEIALNNTAAYLDTPSAKTLKAAKKSCAETMVSISELPVIKSALTPEDGSELVKLGVNAVDYDSFFQYAETYSYENLQTLTLIFYYLDNAPQTDEVLREVVNFNIRFHAYDRKIMFYGINHLLCGFTDNELGDFKTDFLPGLKSLSADGLPWETDKAVIEAKTNYWFTEMERDLNEYIGFEGEQYLLYLEARDDYKVDLIESGCTPEKAETLIAMLEKSAQIQEKEAYGNELTETGN